MTIDERATAICSAWYAGEGGIRALAAKELRAAVAEEREACAKLAESTCTNERSLQGVWQSGPKGDVIAQMIRARSENG